MNIITEMILNLRRLDDYDRLTDWIRPLARGLAIYSFDRQLKTQPSPCETGIVVDVLFSHSISTLYNSL